ncbi:MAG: type II toxin-antitoxin system RelE/ParE family toxin [Patescibacteria group bacterium]
MKIKYHKNFLKNYKKRISPNPKLVDKFQKRLGIFLDNFNNPVLKNHKLTGKLSIYNSFSVTGDIRVIYKIEEDSILLFDIGTHNQVY